MALDPERVAAGLPRAAQVGQLWLAGLCGGEPLALARENFARWRFGALAFSANFQRFVRDRDFTPCGVCRNRPLAEVARFLHEVREAGRELTGLPVLLAGDQEGGMHFTAFRRREATALPPPLGLAAAGGPALARRAGEVAGREARALGLDLLFGPGLDVLDNSENREIDSRSFGDDPRRVAALGAAYVRGLAAAGAAGAAKHFPGRGRGRADAHHELERIPASLAELEARDLLPFRRAIAAGVQTVMVSHTVFPALDAERPASLSPAVIGYLRRELGFAGVVLTDALCMWAIARNYDVARACVMALEAGADLFFLKDPPRYPALLGEVEKALAAGTLKEERLVESVARVLRLKERLGLFAPAGFAAARVRREVGQPAHRRLARELARRSLTLLRPDRRPAPAPRATPVLAVVPRDLNVIQANDQARDHGMLRRALARRFAAVAEVVVDVEPTAHQRLEAVSRARNAGLVVCGVYTAGLTPGLAALAAELAEVGAPLAFVLACAPYHAARLPAGARVVLCCYGLGEFQLEAAADFLAGKLAARGDLPVAL